MSPGPQKRSALEQAGIWSRISFAWVGPLIKQGWVDLKFEQDGARFLMPARDDAPQLSKQFEQSYAKVKGKVAQRSDKKRSRSNLTTLALLRLYWPQLLLHSFWVLVEIGIRLSSPVILKKYLTWLQGAAVAPPGTPTWPGWLWALGVAAGGMGMTLVHHQFFWIGMKAGFTMRQQLVAAIHAKVLRLNSAAVGHANIGRIINLASNDVRRFDDGISFWLFVWAGPLEAAMVLLMVSLELGFVPAVCGMAAMLAVIPIQALLVRTIAGLRRNTAQRTDERVRLTGEVIQGCLAMKMLGWEDPFTSSICAIRAKEASFAARMAQIKGLNLALQFCMTPVVSFVTFSVYRALHGELNLPSVFYALSLLHLPKLYLVYFAVIGFQYLTETFVALQRIDKFLGMPEPPPAVHMRAREQRRSPSPAATESVGTANKDVNSAAGNGVQKQAVNGQHHQQMSAVVVAGNSSSGSDNGVVMCDLPDGYVELGGADYDWVTNMQEMASQDPSVHGSPSNRPQQQSQPQQSSASALTTAASGTSQISGGRSSMEGPHYSRSSLEGPTVAHKTLCGVRLVVQPGELVAVVGEVGAGKSSLLAALLGELMPVKGPDGVVQGGPIVVGKVAYCSQVPWIMPASLRDNVTFQRPMQPAQYNAVIDACALNQDLAELPAGDLTELGERGVNLSGGQKARVALARAAYSGASVHLLDDPLSAVDPRVGQVLFDKCIGPTGLLQGCTRILVTHQRQYLPKCDRIAVLRHGQLVACGTYEEVAALQLPELIGGAVTMSLDVPAEQQQDQQHEQGQQPRGLVALPEQHAVSAGQDAAVGGVSSQTGQQEEAGTSSSSAGSSAETDPEFGAERMLSRIRTMAPDINRRPADSGRVPPSSSNGALAIAAGGNTGRVGWFGSNASFVRVASRVRDWGSGFFQRPQEQQQLQVDAADLSPYEVSDNNHEDGSSGGFWARMKLRVYYAVAGLFTPPAYLPGGLYYNPPPKTILELQDMPATGYRKASVKGLLALGPVRSVLQQPSLRFSSSGKWIDPSGEPAGAGKAVVAAAPNGIAAAGSSGAAKLGANGAAAGAAVGQLVAAEGREIGSVSWSVYGQYCKQLGVLTSVLLVCALFAGQGLALAAEWWLALWAASPPYEQRKPRWLAVYGGLTGGVIVVALLRASLFFWATIMAATRMHNSMILRVLRAPLSFFHTNPAGRVLNRFSNDQGRVDDMLPLALFDVLQTGFMCLGVFVLVASAVPFILPVFLVLLIIFYYFRQRYIMTSREVKRWDATSRSPVYASLSTTLKGLPTIRAYGAESAFQAAFIDKLSLNGNWWFAYLASARWIGFRLDLIATITLTLAVLLATAVRQHISAAVLALALTHVLQLTGMLQWWTRQTVEVENNMTSVERMVEYINLPQEPPRLREGGKPPPEGWPSSGALSYHNVTASYRPGLPPVLRNLSFNLQPGTSCGVVGRTGSGKSSLMLSLFRLIDINMGSIMLDGVDTASIALDSLRKQLAIIPQDPVLFSGTLRSNLDPWDQHDDAALWRVLSAVQLKAAIRTAGGLHVRMAEAGENLSVGQRQLFCLARALLQEARVLALDEATANVDRSTDALIQRSLREFAGGQAGRDTGRVLLVIAHRIDTILDCDHLLVLSNGSLVQQGAPTQLSTGDGVFAGMVSAAKAAASKHHH